MARALLYVVLATAGLAAALQTPMRALHPRMDAAASPSDGGKADVRRQIAKARRAVVSEGKGGTKIRSKAKRSEQKKPSSGKGFGAQSSKLKYDRRPSSNAVCACGNGMSYGDCRCFMLHEGAAAATPEELVRARYTAYAYRLPDFLMRTTDPNGAEYEADHAGWKRSLLGFCDDFEFQKLEVDAVREGAGSISQAAEGGGAAEGTAEAAELAEVDFRADFAQKGTLKLMVLKETSTLRKSGESGWLYAQGEVSYDAQSVEMSEEDRQRLHEKMAEMQQNQ